MNNNEKYELINSWLIDDVSHQILKERHLYNQDDDVSHIQKIVNTNTEFTGKMYHPGAEQSLISLLSDNQNKRVFLYGAGLYGRDLRNFLISKDIRIDGFLDKDYGIMKEAYGYPVYEPSAELCCDSIVIITMKKYNEVYDTVASWHPYRLYNYADYRITESVNQYFDESIITFESDEYFVDAGVLNLETSLEYNEICRRHGSDCHVYAFEPDDTAYSNCVEIASRHPELDVKLYNAGLYDFTGELHFNAVGDGAGYVSDNGNSIIKVTSLDAVAPENVTYIKMDIEGSELKALIGARNTIKKFRPKLAICLYHKPEDIYEIPIYVKQLDPTYKLYIRHYSNYIGETVLYAV